MNTIRYVFESKQPELRRLVVKYGLAPATDSKDLWIKTNYLVGKFKGEMMKDIADIHPDKDLILWGESDKELVRSLPPIGKVESKEEPVVKSKEQMNESLNNFFKGFGENKSNACGCSGADGEYSNCAGNPSCNCDKDKGKGKDSKFSNAGGDSLSEKTNMPLVIIGSLIVIGGFLLYHKAQ